MTVAAAAPDRPLVGIALMVAFCVAIPLSDALSKLMAEAGLAVLVIVWTRFTVQAAVLTPLALATGGSLRLSPLGWRLTAARTALQAAGIWAMVTGLTYLPLADALAIAFVMPFLLLLAGHLLLGEPVGPHRLAACAAGFAGTLMVIRPAFAEVGWPVLYPLAVAVIFAAFMLVTRRLAREAAAVPMQALSGLMATAGLAPLLLVAAPPPLSPFPGGWLPILLGAAAIGTLAHLLMTASLRHAPATVLAPMQYLEIPMAVLVGLVVFGDLPDGLAALGICVTVAAGLYTVWRERIA